MNKFYINKERTICKMKSFSNKCCRSLLPSKPKNTKNEIISHRSKDKRVNNRKAFLIPIKFLPKLSIRTRNSVFYNKNKVIAIR